jgi:Uma2 family endonuclease
MREELVSPPRTIMEVFKMLPEGTLAEVIENTLYMSPAPTPFHQEILLDISARMLQFVRSNELGKVYCSPVDVYLNESANAVQPDILFVSDKNNVLVDNDGIHGVPDLIIEILSPGNKKHDQVTKKNLYEKVGVKEYWIVDPETKEAIGYWLSENQYEIISALNGKVASKLLDTTISY